jgi:hypothetical protein
MSGKSVSLISCVLLVGAISLGIGVINTTLVKGQPCSPGALAELTADKYHYEYIDTVTFTLANVNDVNLCSRGVDASYWIENASGQKVREDNPIKIITPQLTLEVGESMSWTWDQTYLIYDPYDPYSTIPPTGQHVPAGTYVAKFNYYYPDQTAQAQFVLGDSDGPVKFRGTVASAEDCNVFPVCYGDCFCDVNVTQILDDPYDLLLNVSSVEVCYGTDHRCFKEGDRVEVSGYYWKYFGPMQCIGRVVMEEAGYIILIEFIPGDINKDYYVDFLDVAILARNWLECNNPVDANCTWTP